jgi:hypothetical protein
MRAGPKINADDVTSSCVLFLTCRGEKIYTVFYNDREAIL